MSINTTPQIIASTVLFMVLTTSAVALRLVSRSIKKLYLASDDYITILALVCRRLIYLLKLPASTPEIL